MKAIFEVEFNDHHDMLMQLRALAGLPETGYICKNRLMLLKDIRDLTRAAMSTNIEPTLTDLRNLVWKHVTPTNG